MIISIFKVTLSALQITRCFNAVPALSSHLIWNPWKIVPEVIIFNCWEHRSWLSDWSAVGTLNGILFRIWYMSLGIHQTQMMCKRKERQNFIFFFWSFCPAAKMQNEGKLRNWCPRKLVLKCHVKEYLNIPVWKLYLAYLWIILGADLSLLHTDVLKEMIAAGTELLLSDITNSYNKVLDIS